MIDQRSGDDSSLFDPITPTRAEAVATYLACLAAHNRALAEYKKCVRTVENPTVDWRVTDAALKAAILALNRSRPPQTRETVCGDCKGVCYDATGKCATCNGSGVQS